MTSPNCRLFLVAPGDGDAGLLADCLAAAMAAGDVASLLVTQASDAGMMQQLVQRLLPIAQSGEVAVLMENDCDMAKRLNCDGVEITADIQPYRESRSLLGDGMIIGANCGGDRHRAMELAENGADYVRIDPFAPGPGDETLVTWWSQLFEIPSVTTQPLQNDEITRATKTGADFVRPDDAMWTSPQAATETIEGAMAAIGAARS